LTDVAIAAEYLGLTPLERQIITGAALVPPKLPWEFWGTPGTVRDPDSASVQLVAPVASWSFDEGNGMTATDASGNGHHGTLQNGVAWAVGQLGGALSFDGLDDYVQIGARPGLVMTTRLTISAWIYPTGTGADAVEGGIIVSKEG